MILQSAKHRRLFQLLLTSSIISAAAQNCSDSGDCSTPLDVNSTVTCYRNECETCANLRAGGYQAPYNFSGACAPLCSPGGSGNAFCQSTLRSSNPNYPVAYCSRLTGNGVAGYSNSSAYLLTGSGERVSLLGICAMCQTAGHYVNAAGDACGPSEEALLPSIPPGVPATPRADSNASSEGHSPSLTVPSHPSQHSDSPATHSNVPDWVICLVVSAAGVFVLAINAVLFIAVSASNELASERQKHPLADAIRTRLKLKLVDNFNGTLGLQFKSAVRSLEDSLEQRKVLRPPRDLGDATPSLAAAISEVLTELYFRGVNPERSFVEFFAKDSVEPRAKLAEAVEAKVRGSWGWSQELLLPGSLPTMPEGVSKPYWS